MAATDLAIDFELRGEHIALDALLKATGLADSGGRAKAMVAAGLVQVDGQPELRKTCKLRAGQVVALAGAQVRILAARRGAAAPLSTRRE
jgi:ribosome-associated protein